MLIINICHLYELWGRSQEKPHRTPGQLIASKCKVPMSDTYSCKGKKIDKETKNIWKKGLFGDILVMEKYDIYILFLFFYVDSLWLLHLLCKCSI